MLIDLARTSTKKGVIELIAIGAAQRRREAGRRRGGRESPPPCTADQRRSAAYLLVSVDLRGRKSSKGEGVVAGV